jgi:FkbM family methyltransferase
VPTFVKVPRNESVIREFGAYPSLLNVGDGSTSLQRGVATKGLSGFEPSTQTTLLTLVQLAAADRGPVEFFDIGAHVGMHSLLIATIYPADLVHATGFEPTPLTGSIFRGLAAANQLPIRIERCAVAAEDGTAELFISPWDTSNSLAEGFRPATDSFSVPTYSVDSYCAERGVQPDVVKIDVETLESQVLLGSVATLERSRASIVCEMLPAADPDRISAALEALVGIGYHLHRFLRGEGWLPCSADDIINQIDHYGRDWLFTSEPVDERFRAAFSEWRAAVAECTGDTSRRAPRDSTRAPATYGSPKHGEPAGPVRRLASRVSRLSAHSSRAG